MNQKVNLPIIVIISILSFLVFSFLAIIISAKKILQFDNTIISFVQGLESPGLTSIMKLFSIIGDTPAVIVLSLVVLLFLYVVLKHRSELVLFVVALSGSAILNLLLKYFFQRARPEIHRLVEIEGYSFPSGHAMNACTVYTIIAFLLWHNIATKSGRTILIFISAVMILSIGISRIYLGVHYPSDIIGGYLASGTWITIAIWYFQKYQDKYGGNRRLPVRGMD
jgi:undecaprenyl-diphosphatase